ncbi:hypothetical protein [Pseudoduganella namucuonensis]|uniref:Uncharacterized protein n=1 Tax=Pseudoduganella namucuonensis TaxID=1035707 RepID=A0A1I7I389_9BURK|nr:hypothetical protein [Pseudoduganella namucuonensis]SFU67395.1 hypothetical protein SAMN05216552_100761 [Pseudoduganella namucuonensis]
MSDTEKEVMTIYRESAPDESRLFWRTYVNHFAWSLALVAITFSAWLMIALANTENQRNALLTKKCMDPVFKTEFDTACLKTVRTRDHWWQHVGYALTNAVP